LNSATFYCILCAKPGNDTTCICVLGASIFLLEFVNSSDSVLFSVVHFTRGICTGTC
jgi:hypothetical protein